MHTRRSRYAPTRSPSKPFARLLIAVLTAVAPIGSQAGTMPAVGSDDYIRNGDFADPILMPDSPWLIETVGTANVVHLNNPGIPNDDTGLVTLFATGAGSIARLVSECIPLNDPGPGFEYLLTARYRLVSGTPGASSISTDYFSDLSCNEPAGGFVQSAINGLGEPTGGSWSLLRASAGPGSIRITLAQTSSGSDSQGSWDDIRLRVPNFPESFDTRTILPSAFDAFDSESDDRLGSFAAVGDFNGDGRDDVALGVPLKDRGSDTHVGTVVVAYGSANGLSTTGSQALEPPPQADQQAGAALAAGDFNCDGIDDLAIGAPEYTAPIIASSASGAVFIVDGTPAGLDGSNFRRIERSSGDIFGLPSTGDRFGAALTVGNFNRDGVTVNGVALNCDDLAIGAPGVEIGTDETGAVFLLFGSTTGLNVNFPDPELRVWHQGRANIGGAPEDGDEFGAGLVNFDRNYASGRVFPDVLGMSSPADFFNGDSGATVLLPGINNNELMNPSLSQLLTPSDFNLPGQRFLQFGRAASSGMDYSSQELFAELAVGAPFSDVPSALQPQTGLVARYRPFTTVPPTAVNPSGPNTGSRFGHQLVHADTLNRGIPGELWVSEPGRNITQPLLVASAGQVVRLGRDLIDTGGIIPLPGASFGPNLLIIGASADDEFGTMLVRGNFNGFGGDEILIGVPGFDWPLPISDPTSNSGALLEISWDRDPVPRPDPDLLFGDSFEALPLIIRGNG